MNIEMISANEVKNYINKEGIQFIDLRDREEYDTKHIRGALNIPFKVFSKEFQKLSKEETYILYCDRGGMSLMAAKEMSNAGYETKSLNGGMKSFSQKKIE